MIDSLTGSIAVFIGAATVITLCGIRLTDCADRLADKTGWGEALMGGLFLAGVTSVPDFAATLTAAADDYPELAMGNILGSMAANLAFLALGDLTYRRANLEHAAASSGNLIQAGLFIVLLTIPLLAMLTPTTAVLGVHPATPILLVAYLFGYNLVRQDLDSPMWRPRHTEQTVIDEPEGGRSSDQTLFSLWFQFLLMAALTGIAGWQLMSAAEFLVERTPLSQSVVGTLLTAVFTSLPELVTTLAAIRYGALTLAVGNILGTNCFNILVIAGADFAYRGGSIYHAVTSQQLVWSVIAILLTGVLLLGMLRRERYGIAGIGFESFLVLVVYLGAAIGVVLL
jgi:cation:H+ antiporter